MRARGAAPAGQSSAAQRALRCAICALAPGLPLNHTPRHTLPQAPPQQHHDTAVAVLAPATARLALAPTTPQEATACGAPQAAAVTEAMLVVGGASCGQPPALLCMCTVCSLASQLGATDANPHRASPPTPLQAFGLPVFGANTGAPAAPAPAHHHHHQQPPLAAGPACEPRPLSAYAAAERAAAGGASGLKSLKGLRHFSMRVCEKVESKGSTTYTGGCRAACGLHSCTHAACSSP